ncbi:MAG: hypothetical protein JKY22_00420, partial [Flavobacteriaceae bacterium]|nr:hypothetical protein [Flavobacteriaceae bacterium]
MKKPSDHLFKLIKTLTKSEKRAFRLNAMSGKDAKKYVAIFDAIDNQEAYDEAVIKEKFAKEKWIGRFNAAKDYVYRALLNDLALYNQKHEPQYQLADFLVHIRVLQSKGFYKRCTKLIEKAKTLAIELGDHLKLLELLNLEGLNHPAGINPDHSDDIKTQQLAVFKMLEIEAEFDEKYKKTYEIISRMGYTNFNDKALFDYDKIMNLPMLEKNEMPATFHAQRQFINIHYFYAQGKGLDEDMHYWICKAKDLFESNPKLIKQHVVNYATTLLNLHSSFLRLKEYDQAFDTLNLLRTFYPKNQLKTHERLTYIIEYAALHHEITTYNEMGEFKRAVEEIPVLESYLKRHEQEVSLSVTMRHYYLIALSYFGIDSFKLCKQQLNHMLELPSVDLRVDLKKQAKILMLLVWVETKKFDLLEYELRGEQRYFQKNGGLNDLEKLLFKVLGFACNHFDNREKALHTLNEMKDLSLLQQFNPNYTEIMLWFEGKLTGKSFSRLVKLAAK